MADSGETVLDNRRHVNNPATDGAHRRRDHRRHPQGDHRLGAAETRRAIEAAERAWPAWRAKTGKERGALLRRWYELIIENQEDLALIMTSEQGKPLAESMGEVVYGASFIEWFAEEAKRVYGDTIPGHQADKRIVVLKQPIGVVAAITPWNFPNAMITRKCAPALGGRLPGGDQAGDPDALLGAGPGGAGRAGRDPGRHRQRGDRLGFGHRRRAHRQPHRAQALLHRLHRDRQAA